jgi:hypothetical protein
MAARSWWAASPEWMGGTEWTGWTGWNRGAVAIDVMRMNVAPTGAARPPRTGRRIGIRRPERFTLSAGARPSSAMNRLALALALALPLQLALLAAGCSHGGGGGGGAPADPVALSQRFPIDGVVDFTGLTTTTVTLTLTGTGPAKDTTFTWAMVNDDVDLYVALEWADDTFNSGYDATGPTDFDGEDNRILIAATAIGSMYADQHKSATGADQCGDGFGRLAYDAGTQKYHAEMLFPWSTDAQGEDASITTATRFNLLVHDHTEPSLATGDLALLFPGDADTTAWGTVPYATSPKLKRPAIPSGLTGRIVFTSTHEDPEPEIYTFDPATRVVTRVTNNLTFEDNVSLSHDRQWIAFHAASMAPRSPSSRTTRSSTAIPAGRLTTRGSATRRSATRAWRRSS